jgi:hypothetical protein
MPLTEKAPFAFLDEIGNEEAEAPKALGGGPQGGLRFLARPGPAANDRWPEGAPEPATLGRIPVYTKATGPNAKGEKPIGRCFLFALTIALRRRGFTSATIAEGSSRTGGGHGWYKSMRRGYKRMMTESHAASSWADIEAVLEKNPKQVLIVSLSRRTEKGTFVGHAATAYKENGITRVEDAAVLNEGTALGAVEVGALDRATWTVKGYRVFREDVMEKLFEAVPNEAK